MSTIEEQEKAVNEIRSKIQALPWAKISDMQQASAGDRPARGAVWISRNILPAPEDSGLRDALFTVCENLKESYHKIPASSTVVSEDVNVEFIGCRLNAEPTAQEPDIPEREKLEALERDCAGDMTIMYLHGGALCMGSPTDHRASTCRLARLTKARVASMGYRLAPAHPFPTAILDALVGYLSLLYPPPGSLHNPVAAEKIVITGESAGANLCFGLIKVLLELRKTATLPGEDPKVLFHGRQVSLPLPAGITTCNSWCDLCDALPSWQNNNKDILLPVWPALLPGYPTDDIWPSKPPREHPYTTAANLDHELVSPAAVKDWKGAPPMWFACSSEERGLDGNKVVASQAARSGVPVQWTEYEGMPHEFAILMGYLPQAKHCFSAWATACQELGAGRGLVPKSTLLKMPACEVVDCGNPVNLAPLPFEAVRSRMREFNRRRRIWTGKEEPKAKI